MTQPIDQPRLRHNLHPRANAGGAGANPHQTKIAVVKCLENSGDQSNILMP
jgi:hypothetical protein